MPSKEEGEKRIPKAIQDYLDDNYPKSPVALVGCRAHDDAPLECCEYDIAVFADGENRIIRQSGNINHAIEIIHVPKSPKQILSFDKIIVLHDSDNLSLSSIVNNHVVNRERRRKHTVAQGRKILVNSLFYHGKADTHTLKSPIISSMFLKFASYEFIRGIIALNGTRPMPLHELKMVRQADLFHSQDAILGIEVALDSIGIERATRPAIQRSIEGLEELTSNRFDGELNRMKINYLLENEMLADCYYFMGRLLAESLDTRKSDFYNKYSKLVQIAMDLAVDSQVIEKKHVRLSKITKAILARS